ncbi:hypothetical protein ACFFWC_00495 [Plantactinospora siamensis]|uniref:Uncharacterized protein n=1 Tax=Plantactinospora siamensis TaxID=555372 RepID=A0ABV6NTP7_9ACTN
MAALPQRKSPDAEASPPTLRAAAPGGAVPAASDHTAPAASDHTAPAAPDHAAPGGAVPAASEVAVPVGPAVAVPSRRSGPGPELPAPRHGRRAAAGPATIAPPVVRGLNPPPAPLPGFQQPFPVQRVDSVGASDRMLGLCGWATVLGVLGTVAAVRGLFAIRAGAAPEWYEPTLATVGLASIGCIVAAFTLVRRARLPWLLLGLATVPVLVNVGLTVGAL